MIKITEGAEGRYRVGSENGTCIPNRMGTRRNDNDLFGEEKLDLTIQENEVGMMSRDLGLKGSKRKRNRPSREEMTGE